MLPTLCALLLAKPGRCNAANHQPPCCGCAAAVSAASAAAARCWPAAPLLLPQPELVSTLAEQVPDVQHLANRSAHKHNTPQEGVK